MIPALHGRKGFAFGHSQDRAGAGVEGNADRVSLSRALRSLCRVAPAGHWSAPGGCRARKPWELRTEKPEPEEEDSGHALGQ